jgi:putative SOS response-associated peptidase YedK
MCGRFTLSQSATTLAQTFHVEITDWEPKYNIAPTQMVWAVLYDQTSEKRKLEQLRWGLIPSWAKDPGMGAKLINARSETVAEKPAFRSAFKRRRCLIVADGFYEWQQRDGKKQPFYFRLKHGEVFGFAGLWEEWQGSQKETTGERGSQEEPPKGGTHSENTISSCTILTTRANELLEPVHDRMPVILHQKDYDLWLAPQVQTPEMVQQLLQPYPSEAMTAYAVSTIVNNPKYDRPDCIQAVSMKM